MGLNDIELTKPLVALLFGDSLIDCNSVESPKGTHPGPTVLIFANFSENNGKADGDLLSGIMKACKLKEGEYRICDLVTGSVETALQGGGRPNCLLFFGEPKELKAAGIDWDHFAISTMDGIPVLAIPALEKIGADKKTKMAAWDSLKTFFSI